MPAAASANGQLGRSDLVPQGAQVGGAHRRRARLDPKGRSAAVERSVFSGPLSRRFRGLLPCISIVRCFLRKGLPLFGGKRRCWGVVVLHGRGPVMASRRVK